MRNRRRFEFSPRMLLILLTVICVLLLSVSVFFGNAVRPFKSIVTTVVVPMQNGIKYIGAWASGRAGSARGMEELIAENEALTQQVETLTEENENLSADQEELESLRGLLELKEEYSDYETVGARVIGSGSGNWYENMIINKGSGDGIAVNMNVLAAGGLVGIVTEGGTNYAKVESIISDGSSVSAMATSTDDTCVVQGNMESMSQDGCIDVNYISKDAVMKEGDTLVTSHISSKYLPGFEIGTIRDITLDSSNLTQSAKVTPVVDFRHLKDVLVVTELKEVPKDSESAD